MSLPLIRPQPTRIIYVFGVLIVSLFIMGFLWFIMYAVITPIQASIATSMSPYDVANSTYANYELADTFMTNLWAYMLVFVVFILLYWVYLYSQRKGEVFYR